MYNGLELPHEHSRRVIIFFQRQKFEYKTTKMKLGFVIIFTILIVSAFFGSTEAGWLKKKLKKVEKAGQRVRDAAEKALPIVSGYAPIIATAGR
ncbi:cecropin-A-like isoform X2 [Aethina tumida]|uniref:cecropin-A-like isoform X2 n=1 Tax=Aethina tumida TaxID=116153 RepID=UPI00214924AF|nr:cecropin-A-like isoform X2 [Aethina tumida]